MTIKSAIRGFAGNARSWLGNWFDFLEAERTASTPHGFSRPDLLLRGFLSNKARSYDLCWDGLDAHLTDWDFRFRLFPLNPSSVVQLLGNKLYFQLYLRALGKAHLLPELIGTIGPDGFVSHSRFLTLQEVLYAHGRLIKKPINDSHGVEVA